MSMTVGVVGNCQSRSFARTIELLIPGSQASVFDIGVVASEASEDRKAEWLRALSEADIVFTVPLAWGVDDGFKTASLEKICRRLVLYPAIAFMGYQPDSIYIQSGEGYIEGPMGPYQSALAAGAFLEGLSVERTIRLFNSYVFASLGYFDQFETERVSFQETLRQMGYSLDALLQGDPFMHTINHPFVSAIHAITVQALDRAGIPFDRSLIQNMPDDNLANSAVWPIYPEIARAIGKSGGGYRFFYVTQGEKNLPEFVKASFDAFTAVGTGFSNPAVERVRQFLRSEII